MQEPGDIRYFLNATQRFNVRAAVLLENAGRLLVTPEADQPECSSCLVGPLSSASRQ